MDTSSAPSLLTKEINDLSQGEMWLISLVLAGVLFAVLLGFGIKTYLHQRKSAPANAEAEETAAAVPPSSQPVHPGAVRGASTRQRPSPPDGLRAVEPALSRIENGS
ncbi:hypothetical protein OF385_15375 [Glutamicibacter sp. JL.03c]|uniref:hypothetical protein n=1 Tax=Glutamicibacter sp. JL.03c TaxID=2984842 RepID=UPI0021F7AD35|nr:hypothetical protein [Glutamicibacter sp. JL.03c]UYQ77373.1 hypothetical protein OF385_15375 [Glutamicibacter sp. JL.03c]